MSQIGAPSTTRGTLTSFWLGVGEGRERGVFWGAASGFHCLGSVIMCARIRTLLYSGALPSFPLKERRGEGPLGVFSAPPVQGSPRHARPP